MPDDWGERGDIVAGADEAGADCNDCEANETLHNAILRKEAARSAAHTIARRQAFGCEVGVKITQHKCERTRALRVAN